MGRSAANAEPVRQQGRETPLLSKENRCAFCRPVAAGTFQQGGLEEEIPDRIDVLLRPAVEAELFSGVVLVARGDEILYHEPFGYADWQLHPPNTRATRFGVASITKAMTEVVELLVREG